MSQIPTKGHGPIVLHQNEDGSVQLRDNLSRLWCACGQAAVEHFTSNEPPHDFQCIKCAYETRKYMTSLREDIEFLKQLQAELNNQDTDCQAAPRFWTVGDYRWIECMEDNAERYYVYLPSAGESYELDSYLEEIKEDDEMSDDELEEFNEIGCEVSGLEWIQKYRDEGAYTIPTKKEHFVRENTMFLTKAEAKRHIELNHYHYTNEAHTYAMTAWRAPKVERLLKILSEFNFDHLSQSKEVETACNG